MIQYEEALKKPNWNLCSALGLDGYPRLKVKNAIGLGVDPAWYAMSGWRGVLPFMSSAVQVEVSSSNVNDVDLTGLGAWKIKIIGLDGDWNPVEEIISLNGQTGVLSQNTYLRINDAFVVEAGTGLLPYGNIYVYDQADTPAAGIPASPATSLFAAISQYTTESFLGRISTARGQSLDIIEIYNNIYIAASAYIRYRYYLRNSGSPVQYLIYGTTTTPATFECKYRPRPPIRLGEMSDFQLEYYSPAASGAPILPAHIFYVQEKDYASLA